MEYPDIFMGYLKHYYGIPEVFMGYLNIVMETKRLFMGYVKHYYGIPKAFYGIPEHCYEIRKDICGLSRAELKSKIYIKLVPVKTLLF